MRILFTFTGGTGHFLPGLPIARALVARGHAVAFSAQEAMLATIEATGFTGIDSGGATLADPAARLPLQPVDRAHEERVVRDSFAGRLARERAGRLLAVAGEWSPDVVVRDEVDFGAAVAAERLGLPHASIIVLAAGGMIRPDLLRGPLDRLRAEHGLPADPGTEMLHRHLTLVPVPASFRSPSDPLPDTAHHIRPAALAQPVPTHAVDDDPGWLEWLRRHPDRPTVYFTLGTVFHQESGDLFTRVLSGLGALHANVIVTVGREIDPAELGPQPENVHVERFITQERVLPHCDLVVSHAGSGSVIGALAFGVPQVLLPMGADQPLNADRCESLGVARVLDPLTAQPNDLAEAATDVLNADSYSQAAARLRDETAHLPPADHAATLIETLP
jgi:UDP:flavonoid glycosyltransferase YjiC (YdhE family)